MKVLHVVEACGGGVGKHVIDLVTTQNAQGLEVHLAYSGERADAYFQRGLESLPKSVSLFVVRMGREIEPAQDLRAFRQLYQIVRSGAYDVVHAHSSKAGVLARLAARFAGRAVSIYTPHSVSIQPAVPLVKRSLYWCIEKVMGYLTDAIVAVSHQEADEIRQLRLCRRDKIVVVHNGIDQKKVSVAEREAVRAELEVTAQTSLVVGVGRLTAQKDPLTFVRVAEHVVREHPDVLFVWAGDGDLLPEVTKAAQALNLDQHVKFLGYRGDVPNLLAAADVYLHTARYEGLPYSLMEALGLQTPAVTTDIAGARDLLVNDSERYIVPVGDVSGLAMKTLELLTDLEQRAKVTAAAVRVRRQFTVEAMAKNLISLYERGVLTKRSTQVRQRLG